MISFCVHRRFFRIVVKSSAFVFEKAMPSDNGQVIRVRKKETETFCPKGINDSFHVHVKIAFGYLVSPSLVKSEERSLYVLV